MEDGVIGIDEGNDFFLHPSQKGRLVVMALRYEDGKEDSKKKGREKYRDFHGASCFLVKKGRKGQKEGGRKDETGEGRIQAEVESGQNDCQGNEG